MSRIQFNSTARYTAKFRTDEAELMNWVAEQMGEDFKFQDIVVALAREAKKRHEMPQASDKLQEDLAKAQATISQLQAQVMNLTEGKSTSDQEVQDEMDRLRDQARQVTEINTQLHNDLELARAEMIDPESQLVVSMTPFERHLIVTTSEKESKRLKRTIDGGTLLKQMLLSYYLKGTHDHFPMYFSRADLRRLAAHYEAKKAQANGSRNETTGEDGQTLPATTD
jgi:hypothetical protein